MKRRIITILLFLSLAIPTSNVKANELSQGLIATAVFEAGLFAHSWLLTESSYGYGAVSGLLYPFAVTGAEKNETYWITLAAAEGMNIYNAKMADDDVDRDKIFKRNILGWHLVFAASVVSNVYFKSREVRGVRSKRFSYAPTEYGGQFRLDFKF